MMRDRKSSQRSFEAGYEAGYPIPHPRRARQGARPRRANHARRKMSFSYLQRAFLVIVGAVLLLLGTTSVSPLLWSLQHPTEEVPAQLTSSDLPHQPTLTPPLADDPPPDVSLVAPPPDTPASPTASAATAEAAIPAEPFPGVPLSDDDREASIAIMGYLGKLTTEGAFSGVVLVARNGAILVNQGYGMADREQRITNTPQTRFRLASLTKPFTAMAILILQHEGRLNIHDPACNYLDDCPEAWQAITIRHLLTHTSGLPNYTDFIDFETTEMLATTPEELIARFRDMPLLFEPGSMYGYCNSGYVLLGVIIEQVAGQPYEEVLRTRIFEPLQMNDTGYDHNRESIKDQASGYTNINTRAPFLDASTLHAAGSLYSTVEDMYRWDQALYTEQLIPRPLLDEMFTPFHYGYAYGWRVRREGQRRVISHPGFITGFSNYIARYPDERVTIIILSNLEIAPSPGMSAHIAHLLFDPPDPADPPGEQDEQTTPAPGLEPAED